MPITLCFSESIAQAARLEEIAKFCRRHADYARNHTQRSYWLSNQALNSDWRERALANAIGWASR